MLARLDCAWIIRGFESSFAVRFALLSLHPLFRRPLAFYWHISRHSRYLEPVGLMSQPDLSQYSLSEEVPLPPAQEIRPGDTYQIDSEEYDSDQERDNLSDGEYDKLVEEGRFGSSCVSNRTPLRVFVTHTDMLHWRC